MKHCLVPLVVAMAVGSLASSSASAQQPATRPALPATRPVPSTRPTLWMAPHARDNGKSFRALFEHPEQWTQTRKLVDVLFYTDLNLKKQFSDDELRTWFAMLNQWNLKLAMEVGAVKPWGLTGEKTFQIEKPMWERVERLGGKIHAIAMDEPLCCVRKLAREKDAATMTDEYAVRETAAYIALVRKHYPDMLIGDIEPYPFINLEDQMKWIDALEARLKELGVRGMDFYRLDVNWAEFVVFSRGGWAEVRKLEQYCRRRRLPFGLIYWASGYPPLEKKGLVDDSSWYVSIMQQGYDYALVGGAPEQYVIESWIGAPAECVPETAPWTFTRSVLDFGKRFVPGKQAK